MPRALIPLAAGGFVIGCTEFTIMGLLTPIGASLHASVPAMGLLITAYAIGVMVGAPVMTALSSRITTKQTLMGLMVVFAIGNTVAAIAPNYQTMLAGRVIASLAHGSFFGVGAVAARRSVPPEKGTQAIALMFTGLTVANLAGVPLGTFIGEHASWRLVFAGIAVLGLLTALMLWVMLPDDNTRMDLRAEIGAFRQPAVWFGLIVTTVGFGSLFAVYSYITPILSEITHLGAGTIPLVLALFGLSMTVGTLLGGRMGARYGMRAVAAGLAAVAALLMLFTVTSHHPVLAVLTLFAFGCINFALGPIVQDGIIAAAGTDGSLVSAANQGAFNISNAIGAALGALVIRVGWGYSATMVVGAILALVGFALVSVNLMVSGRRRPPAVGELVGC